MSSGRCGNPANLNEAMQSSEASEDVLMPLQFSLLVEEANSPHHQASSLLLSEGTPLERGGGEGSHSGPWRVGEEEIRERSLVPSAFALLNEGGLVESSTRYMAPGSFFWQRTE